MASIPTEVQEFMEGKTAWVATASPDGVPNATPKGSVRIVDAEHIVFADLFSRKTRENLLANPKVSVTAVDPATVTGYQVKGTAELLESGPLYEGMAAELAAAAQAFPPLVYVVYITVEAVYDQSVGPKAGEKIA